MMRWIFATAASAALVACGIAHGFLTDRWVANEETTKAAELLQKVPMHIGEWMGEDVEVPANQAAPGLAGSLQRRYLNRRLGVTVVIALVNGRPGPVATHTPEVCYGASGYTVGGRKPVALDTNDTSAQFWTADAVRTKVAEETKIRLYWAWNGGEGWVASADARSQFTRARYPVLHKLYVLRDLTGPGSTFGKKEEPCEAFLQVLLPELDRILFHNGA
jgi:hypothetical protein